MIPDIKELNFPQYATLSQATVNIADMAEKSITSQVKIDGNITPDFSTDWEVEFQGEKYIMPLRQPQGAKENTSLNSTIDLTFQHWAIYQLKRWPFVTIQQIAAGTYLPDEEVATVNLNLGDFCDLFGQVLEYYYGGTITIDLNPDWQYKQEATIITISHTKIWNVLIDAFHGKYGVRWEIKAASDNSSTVKGGERYVIRVGYPTTEVDHIFEYGFEGGLLKVERQVQSEEIRNMLKGRGGETNIPFRYFKDTDPNNKDFRPDPDWVEELANIYFPNLMPATFRSYVQGWKAAHISKYPGYTAVGESNAYAPWAYRKGYTDTKFHPVEFVADEITISPATGDKPVEILPGYSPYVKKGSSLDKYGPLPDTLDNNDDIYPTIQGSGMDIAVDVEQIQSDDVVASVESDAVVSNFKDDDKPKKTETVGANGRKTVEMRSGNFRVDTGKYANLDEGPKTFKIYKEGKHVGFYVKNGKLTFGTQTFPIQVAGYTVEAENVSLVVVNVATGEELPASGIPAGTYYFRIKLTLHNTSNDKLTITVSCEEPKVTSATLNDNNWKNTFDIWVKNIWETTKLSTETDTQYAERVWKPILGDREKNTAKVIFTSGALAVSEDYEFTIVDFPVLDASKSLNGDISHWRIKLAKSDADLESTGLYIPSTMRQGKAGDKFVFIGTEMTHHYVAWAERALDDWKKDHLGEVKDIKPTWVVTTDRIRLNNAGASGGLIQKLKAGDSLRLADKRFIINAEGSEATYETLYLQSLTYTYREPSNDDAALNPDVEIVLSDKYETAANPVSTMQGEISALQRQVGAISNIEQIIRAVGDKLYLRKDGINDRSLSPTQFYSLLTSGDFRAGLVGGAGWGFYKDDKGNWVLEADRVNVRQEMSVNTLVINQAEGRGGMEVDTAAFMKVTRVIETANGYRCYFDQKDGSVANLFHVDDVAFCNQWTAENAELKFYKRRITAVDVDSIMLSKTDVNGIGIPEEDDIIIHFGNYTDKTRQYIKVRDVVGGGYERYIEELNSVDAAGVEYYFVGKQAGESRWFVGNKDLVPYSGAGDGSYIEYINRKFNLHNVSLSVETTIGDKTIEEYIKLVSPPVEQEDIEGFVNNIVDPKIEGLQNQIDGVIETWFANGEPTLTNYPANGWNTDVLKIQHLGDLYYDNTTGTAYRFSQNAQGGYYWNTITDDAITKALAAAQKAQDTADGKRRIFTAQPTPPYDKGDLWVNATYPAGTTADTRNPESGKYHNDILRCGTTKASGAAFAISDWGLSSNYTDDTTANKALEEIAGYAYLKEALLDRSTTIGGVFLSSLIRLGQHNESLHTQTVWSGINGIYTKARDISYWAGGDALDLFNDDDTRKTLAEGDRPAAALIRMDGSAYFAKGNIGFRADGSGWLGNDLTGIKFSNTGVMTFGSGISFNVSNVSGLNNTLNDLANFNASLTTLLSPCDANDNEISWQEATQSDGAGGIKAKSLKAKVGLWSVKFVSALGKNDDEGGGIIGATTLAQLTDVSLSTPLNGDVLQYNGQKWVNVAMSTLRPDLTGYATQQWVKDQGYLTSHQSLADYVTLNTVQTITGEKTFSNIVRRKTNTLTRTVFNSDSGYDYLIFGDTAGYTYLRGNTIGFQNSTGKMNVTIANDGVLTAVKLAKSGGTASQILMADGSVKEFSSMASPYLAVQDVRGEVRPTGYFPVYKVSAWFNNTGMPQSQWYSGIHVKGWDNNYASWEIAASANNPVGDTNLYFRNGWKDTWYAWRKILDENNYASMLDGRYLRHAALNGGLIPVETVTTWGDGRGETVAEWTDATGNCALKLKRNNPAAGQISMLLDGTAYVYEGQYEVAAQGRANNFVYSGNEVTFAAVNNADMVLWLNWRLAWGTGSIDEYRLGRGTSNDAYAALRARKFIVNGGTASQFLKADGSVDANGYVNKAGDTMTGLLTIKTDTQPCLKLDSNTANKEVYMYIYSGGVAKNAVGWNANNGAYIYNSPSAKYLGIKDNGTPHFQGNTLWHAGNDGDGSGLDADKLDGWHRDEIRKGVLQFQQYTGTHVTGGYDLNVVAPDGGLITNYEATSYWGNAPQGASYGIALHLKPSAGTLAGQLFADINHDSATDVTRSLWWRARGVSGGVETWGKWHQIAFVDGNVASASKLATARKFWGRSTDWTNDVSGDMTGVGSISFANGASAANIDTYGNFKIGASGVRWTVKNSNNICGLCVLNSNGHVGINTEFPSEMLHVAGNILVSGDMTGVGKITTTTLAIATSYDHTWSDGTNSHPWYGYDHRYHNTGVYSTTISDFYGLTLRTSQGNISMNATGNVGIGTTSPTQKLHVADGNVLVSGEAYYRTEGRVGSSWNNGYGALSVGIMNNNSQTPLLVAYRYGDLNWTTPHANRLFAMELLNSGSVLRFAFGGAAKFYFEKDGTFHTEKGLWAAQYVSSKGASASSDIRLKYGLEPLTLTLEQIAAAPAVRYRWRDTGEVDLGSTSQYWLRILSEGVRIQPNGFYGMAYDKIALVSAILLARHALGVKNRVDNHETRIQKIEQKINQLTA